MKIMVAQSSWVGRILDHIAKAFEDNGHDINRIVFKEKKALLRILKFHHIQQIKQYQQDTDWREYNEKILLSFDRTHPEIFITMNQSHLYPQTIKKIMQGGCKTICLVSDNPFDSSRFTYFPISLRYYDYLLVADKAWIPLIKNVAPNSQIIKIVSGGGFDPSIFSPVEESALTPIDIERFRCDLSFTGESYGLKAEGGYRAGILDQLGKYNLKIWGDAGWKMRFPFYENLEKAYQGNRLPYTELRKLYRLSTINLNMPAPQVSSGFQPRLFEIAACKGFQIVDWREELDDLFSEDELVTFKNIPDLIDKVEYFTKFPDKRQPFIDKLFEKIYSRYTWQNLVHTIIDRICGLPQ